MKNMSDKSIKQQLRYFGFGVLMVSCAAILLSIVVSVHFVRDNSLFLDGIGILSDFYSNVNEMDGYARSFVSNGNEENYSTYEKKAKEAEANIAEMSERLSGENAFRMSFLGNMLDTYDEILSGYLSGEMPWYQCYQKLKYTNTLIQDTARQYHELLVGNMRVEMKQRQQIWVRQIAVISVLFFLILGGVTLFAHRYSGKISGPITEMVDNINLIQKGDYNIKEIKTNQSELKILDKAFSGMAAAIRNNIQLLKYNAELDKRLLEQENENLNIKNLLYQTELKGLQAQINPHFLFNTLNMIAKKAVINGDNETSLLMENVSALLRYGLDKTNKISSLQEEISCIENYFFIQQRRFEGRASFKMDIQENLPNVSMPAMVLQPLVENSVTHGIRDMLEGAEVILKAHCFNGFLHIHVEDNGYGMEAETLELLLASLRTGSSAPEQTGNHIGLCNVFRRLLMYYGDEMNFSIESEVECGTIVTLEIPLEAGESV